MGSSDPGSSRTATSPDGIPIRYAVLGRGAPPIVLVHGWSCDGSYWRGQIDAFARRHLVVVPDLAGHGESGTGRSAWTMAAFGGDVAAVVEAEDVRDAILVGHSMGGDVILEAALKIEDRIKGLVLVDTYRHFELPPPGSHATLLAGFDADFRGATEAFVRRVVKAGGEELVDWIARDMASAAPEAARDALGRAIGGMPGAIEALGKLSVPVVAINPTAVPEEVASMERRGVRHMRIDGVGHFSMLEDPAAFNRILGDAIGAITDGPVGKAP